MAPTPPCPECRAGKHTNCTGWALDEKDQEVKCPCPCEGQQLTASGFLREFGHDD